MAVFKELIVKNEVNVKGDIIQKSVKSSSKYATTLEIRDFKITLRAEDGSELGSIVLPK